MLLQESTRDLGEIAEIAEIMDITREILDGYEWETQLSYGLVILCNIVVIYHFGKIAVENLLQGGEAFVFSKLKTPFFYMMMITAWPTIHSFITDASTIIQDELFVNRDTVYDANNRIFDELDGGMQTVLTRLNEQDAADEFNTERYASDLLGLEKTYDYLVTIDDRLMLAIYSGGFRLASYLDYFLYIVFFCLSSIWLKIIAFGAPIAFVVSLLTGGWTVLINWAKNYLAVVLWLPVSAILMGMINSIFLAVLNTASTPVLSRFNEEAGRSLMSANPLILLNQAVGAIIIMFVLILVFIAIKVIVLAKVPAIITAFTSGGQSVGGGFAAAFIPASVAGTAATTAVSAGVGAAAAAKSGLKK